LVSSAEFPKARAEIFDQFTKVLLLFNIFWRLSRNPLKIFIVVGTDILRTKMDARFLRR